MNGWIVIFYFVIDSRLDTIVIISRNPILLQTSITYEKNVTHIDCKESDC